MSDICGTCGARVAVVDEWAMNYERDGFTPSDRVHRCDPRDPLARAGGGSAAYLSADGTDFEEM